jgi:5-methylcytosine-specific restriction endonuclease McrA
MGKIIPSKRCPGCGEIKPVDEFKNRDPRTTKSRCIECLQPKPRGAMIVAGNRHPIKTLPPRPSTIFEAIKLRGQLARAKKAEEPHTLTIQQWKTTLDYFENRCAYCGSNYAVIEHFVSIGLGIGTVMGNCVPACKSCNALKVFNHSGFLIRAVNIDKVRKFFTDHTK